MSKMPDFNMKFGIFLFYGYDTPSLPAGRFVFCRLLRSCVSKCSRFTTFGCHAATGAASRLASQPSIKTANRFTDCIAEPQPRLCRFIVCASSLNSRSRYRIYPTARFQSAIGFGLHAGRTRLFWKRKTGRLKRFTDCGVSRKH